MFSKIRRVTTKQYIIPYIGEVKTMLGGVLFYLTPFSFVMLAVTTYKVAISPWAAIHAHWLNLWVFLGIMPVFVVLGLIIEYKLVFPSMIAFSNRQGYVHRSPLVADMQQALEKLDYVESQLKGDTVNSFHRLYYNAKEQTFLSTFWLGVPAQKYPSDLWIYQEIIMEIKPDLIIECGTAKGGSALFMASVLEILGKGQVVTIDIEPSGGKPHHKRIEYLVGSSVAKDIQEQVARLVSNKERVMVVLDSDHHKQHVLNELRIYSPFVTRGSYLIVEDTNLNGNPVFPEFGPGPMEAVSQFLQGNTEFVVDSSREKFYMTANPGGYLVKGGRHNE